MSAFGVSEVSNALEVGDYSQDCDKMNVALSTTKAVHDNLKVASNPKISAQTQEVHFPLTMRVTNGKIHFKNDETQYDINGKLYGLPIGVNCDIESKDLFRLVFASSAFPVAFSPFAMSYVDLANPNEANCPPIQDKSKTAPEGKTDSQGKTIHNGRFIDGGAFDNTPLGLAIMQEREQHKKKVEEKEKEKAGLLNQEQRAIYVPLMPGSKLDCMTCGLRSWDGPSRVPDNYNRGLLAFWYSFLGDYLSTSMDTELINLQTYYSKDKDKDIKTDSQKNRDEGILKNIHPAWRSLPATGSYFFHFSAFLDPKFREYDYYLGVFDGMLYMALNSCKNDLEVKKDELAINECMIKRIVGDKEKKIQGYLEWLGIAEIKEGKLEAKKSAEDALFVISMVSGNVLHNYLISDKEPSPTTRSQKVYKAIHDALAPSANLPQANPADPASAYDFKQFIHNLKAAVEKENINQKIAFSPAVRMALDDYDTWQNSYELQLIRRLAYIEKQDKNDMALKLVNAGEFIEMLAKDINPYFPYGNANIPAHS
jgi:hypothetical protein